jgi:hypothetical protein
MLRFFIYSIAFSRIKNRNMATRNFILSITKFYVKQAHMPTHSPLYVVCIFSPATGGHILAEMVFCEPAEVDCGIKPSYKIPELAADL